MRSQTWEANQQLLKEQVESPVGWAIPGAENFMGLTHDQVDEMRVSICLPLKFDRLKNSKSWKRKLQRRISTWVSKTDANCESPFVLTVPIT